MVPVAEIKRALSCPFRNAGENAAKNERILRKEFVIEYFIVQKAEKAGKIHRLGKRKTLSIFRSCAELRGAASGIRSAGAWTA